MKLSVIVPAYNEEHSIRQTVTALNELKQQNPQNVEIIVVNDASVDNTAKILTECAQNINITIVKNPCNMGKGFSVKRGIRYSNGDILSIFDADMAFDVSCITDAIEIMYASDVDVVFGKRSKRGYYPIYRYIPSQMLHFLTQLFLKTGDIDTQCGFKLIKKSAYNKIKKYLTFNDFSYDMQIACCVKHLNIKYENFNVLVKSHSSSNVKIFNDGISMLVNIQKLNAANRFANWI